AGAVCVVCLRWHELIGRAIARAGQRKGRRRGAADRQLPADAVIASEQALLGALLLDASVLTQAGELRAADFKEDRHRLIYLAIADEVEEVGRADAFTVYERLQRSGANDGEFGGLAFLSKLAANATGTANVARYADTIRAAARRRTLLEQMRLAAKLLQRGDEQEARSTLGAAIAAPAPIAGALRVSYPGEQTPQLCGRYLVKGLVPAGVGLIFGASNSGKTAVACDIAFHVAGGLDYRGRRTRPCVVVWLALEAPDSWANRQAAWLGHHGLAAADARVVTITGALDLRDADKVRGLITTLDMIAARMGEAPGLIVVDTLARAMPGADENAGADMGRVIAAFDRLQAEFPGIAVVGIHHTGKDATRGPRGHSSLLAAVDFALEVRDCELIVHKARDAKVGDGMAFELKAVEVGRDEDGDPVTAVVALASGAAMGSKGPPRTLADGAKLALKVLRDLLRKVGVGVAGLDAPPGTVAIKVERWRIRHKGALCAGAAAAGDAKSDAAERQAWGRAITSLQAAGIVSIASEWAFANDRKPRD
ncbi:MAG: AAA family ATPase, partial [Burkholderiaceae bacterium]